MSNTLIPAALKPFFTRPAQAPTSLFEEQGFGELNAEWDEECFQEGFLRQGHLIGSIAAGPMALDIAAHCAPAPLKEDILKADVQLLLSPSNVFPRPVRLLLSYEQFESKMLQLGLRSVYDANFIEKWQTDFAEQQAEVARLLQENADRNRFLRTLGL